MNTLRLFTGWVLLTRAAVAGTSANYTLAPDTVDFGGQRGTSSIYTLNGSVTAGGMGASSTYTARTGFAAQLIEPASAVPIGITITATPPTVDEGGTRQLTAILVYNDSTTVPLAAGSVTWSVQSGPLAGISTAGLASGGAVYQNTAAVALGTWQTFTATLNLTVVNTQPDNFGAYAGDSLEDAWQVQYFGLNNPLAAPNVDPDGDGQDNRFEFVAGVVPSNASSFLRFDFAPVPGQPLQRKLVFSPRLPDRAYVLMAGTAADKPSARPLTGGIVTDNGNERTVLDPDPLSPRKFYHLLITRP